MVFVTWGSNPGQPYVGTAPTDWAHTTARLQSEAERSLADESAGPLAQLLAIPQDGGDDGGDDPLKELKADLRTRARQGPTGRNHGGRMGRIQGQGPTTRLGGKPSRPHAARFHGKGRGGRFRPRACRVWRRHRPYSLTVTERHSGKRCADGTWERLSPWRASLPMSSRQSWKPP